MTLRGKGMDKTKSGFRHALRIRSLSVAGSSLIFSLWVAGCAVGPRYARPVIDAPTAFRDQLGPGQAASLADLPWWEVFKDETLKGLVQEALKNNYDLRTAVFRVEQARQLSAQARPQYYPSVGYQAALGGGKNEFVGNVLPTGGKTSGSMLTALGVVWELDLWGRIRRLNEAAMAQYLATDEGRRGVVLSIVSDVAQAYFELLELDLELDIAKRTTVSFADSLRIFTQRYEGGVASKLETSSAAAALATTSASVPEVERQIAIKENQISVLLGRNPGPIPRTTKLLEQTTPPEIPAGLPSTLLERRPDIRQTEQLVRSANARVGAATADFFPRIGLTALLGQASSELDAFTSGTNSVWSGAINTAGPLFQGGALKARKRQAIAFWEETRIQYQQAVLTAFQEVANALISREKYESQRVEQAKAVAAYEEAVQLSLLRYTAGKASYYEVLRAQQLLFPSENALARTRLNQFVVFVQLYKALGGGWNLEDAQWAGPVK
jgi:multidrug efflux system outer membrane protein